MAKRKIKRRVTQSKFYRETFAEWNILTKVRNLNISLLEWQTYKRNIAKANKKGVKLKNDPTALYSPKFTNKIDVFKTTEQFKRYSRSAKQVIKSDFKSKKNAEVRDNFIENLEANTNVSTETINKIKNMSDADFKEFAKDNGELNSFIWGFYAEKDSGKSLVTSIKLTDNAIESRIDSFYDNK